MRRRRPVPQVLHGGQTSPQIIHGKKEVRTSGVLGEVRRGKSREAPNSAAAGVRWSDATQATRGGAADSRSDAGGQRCSLGCGSPPPDGQERECVVGKNDKSHLVQRAAEWRPLCALTVYGGARAHVQGLWWGYSTGGALCTRCPPAREARPERPQYFLLPRPTAATIGFPPMHAARCTSGMRGDQCGGPR